MTKTNTIAIDNFISHVKSNKVNMVTASVVDGITARLMGKGTITPKQALYLIGKYKKHYTTIPASFKSEILSVIEKGGTQDQQTAEKNVRQELEVNNIEANVTHFNDLFHDDDIKQLVQKIDHNLKQLKSKIGL